MRSPVLAFSIIAATVSPSLIAAAPIPSIPVVSNSIAPSRHLVRRDLPVSVPQIGKLGGEKTSNPHGHQDTSASPKPRPVERRAFDDFTAGGNAHSGGSANASGGNVGNFAESETPNGANAAPLINTASSKCLHSLQRSDDLCFGIRYCWQWSGQCQW